MTALVVLGYSFDGVSLIAGALVTYVISVCACFLFLLCTLWGREG